MVIYKSCSTPISFKVGYSTTKTVRGLMFHSWLRDYSIWGLGAHKLNFRGLVVEEHNVHPACQAFLAIPIIRPLLFALIRNVGLLVRSLHPALKRFLGDFEDILDKADKTCCSLRPLPDPPTWNRMTTPVAPFFMTIELVFKSKSGLYMQKEHEW